MKKLDPQLLLSIGVLVVSFAALFVSIRQASLLNRQTEILLQQMKSSAWPSMSVDMNLAMQNDSAVTAFSVLVTNKGLGPAVVAGVRVLLDDRPLNTWLELFEALEVPDDMTIAKSSSSLYKQVLSAGEEVAFMDLGKNYELMQFLYDHGDRIKIEICYRSIYGEYWLVERDMLTAQGTSSSSQTAACAFPEGDNFRD